jgi:hypothetical protein
MTSKFSSSLSNAIFLSVIALIGVALYAVFVYLVAHLKNVDTRRRWRYSILCGVSSGVFSSVLFGIGFVLALFVDVNQLGFMILLKHPRSIVDIVTGIILFLTYPVLISVPLVFIVTIGTYINQLQLSDLNVTHLLYPVKKHPSDQSPDDIFTQVRIFIAGLIDR